jgi:hypothetical protein
MYIPLNLKEGLIDIINQNATTYGFTPDQKSKVLKTSIQLWCFIMDEQIHHYQNKTKSYNNHPFNFFVNIHSGALEKFIMRAGDVRLRYTFFVNLLKDGGFISQNENYSNYAFPMSYKIETSFIKWPFTEVPIELPKSHIYTRKIRTKEDWLEYFPDEKKVIETHYRTNINISKLDEYLYSNLGRTYKYNWENGVKTEVKLDYTKYMYYLNAAFRFKQKDFFFSRPDPEGRFYTSFNNLPKIVRQFCNIDGKSICEIDLKNAQPLFLSYILEHYTFRKDCELGSLWDKLSRKIDKSRELTKVYVMKYIFHPKNNNSVKSGKTYEAMEELYEGLTKMIDEYRNEENMWDVLQKREAHFFIDCMLKHDIDFLPIHDSIAVAIDQSELAKNIIQMELKKSGILGTLDKKCY